MAAFHDDPDEVARLDWRILQNSAISLYHGHAVLTEDVAWFSTHAYVVHDLACDAWMSAEDFHDAVSRTLGFPDWYGRNLHAFDDALGDVRIPVDSGVLVVLRCFDRFSARFPGMAQHILDIIEGRSRYHMLFGKRLVALVQSDNPKIALEPVGARPVTWNPRELFAWQRER